MNYVAVFNWNWTLGYEGICLPPCWFIIAKGQDRTEVFTKVRKLKPNIELIPQQVQIVENTYCKLYEFGNPQEVLLDV